MPSYDPVILLYLGSVASIFLLNAVQWGLSRDWVYGLFTLQTFIWLIYVSTFGLNQTNAERQVVYTLTMGIVRISYVVLLGRLFTINLSYPRLWSWLRWAQGILVVCLVWEVAVFFLYPNLYESPIYTFFQASYLIFAIGIAITGSWVAAQHRNPVGRFFLIGSAFRFLDEAKALFFYGANLLGLLSLNFNPEFIGIITKIVGAGFFVELLGFSFCLLFRQRQMAIAQAVEQTRLEEQLVQQQLEAELTVRRLEQEKTDVQLRALQAQVNPHFLFNSLSSLSSLIDDGPERAGQFVDQLSQVYRYLLRANEQPLTTLAGELEFIQAYYYLLKTRHGDGLSMTIRINPEFNNRLLPPLTLQLLVENAVKHNVTLIKQPLHIDIFTGEAGQLTVQNNLQRKRTSVLSNGVGLSTILTKYQTLDQPAPVVVEANTTFTVTIPLIEPLVELT